MPHRFLLERWLDNLQFSLSLISFSRLQTMSEYELGVCRIYICLANYKIFSEMQLRKTLKADVKVQADSCAES
jgi:hypothetical protein